MKSRPAMTSGSLLARATFFPEETAEKVGNKPAEPTIPATTICASGSSAMLINPSFPEKTSSSGNASRTCLASLVEWTLTFSGRNSWISSQSFSTER